MVDVDIVDIHCWDIRDHFVSYTLEVKVVDVVLRILTVYVSRYDEGKD